MLLEKKKRTLLSIPSSAFQRLAAKKAGLVFLSETRKLLLIIF